MTMSGVQYFITSVNIINLLSVLICILQDDAQFPDKEELISRIGKKYITVIRSGENLLWTACLPYSC
jgi:hypothetical protein